MPNIVQTEIPRPKSWDEFEDLVCDLYARCWNDPNADRYGRAGQRQHGVDICGRPPALGGRCAGVQEAEGIAVLSSCKYCEESWVLPTEEHSVFTHFLLRALEGKSDRDWIGIEHLWNRPPFWMHHADDEPALLAELLLPVEHVVPALERTPRGILIQALSRPASASLRR